MVQFSKVGLQWLEVILEERFGHKFVLNQKGDELQLSLPGCSRVICFDKLQNIFHQSSSNFACRQWSALAEGYSGPIKDILPAPSEKELKTPLVEWNQEGVVIHYDILGLAYWIFTRLEEVGSVSYDNYDRFPAISSHAYKFGYLDRPIVDEWFNVLGQIIQQLWPGLELKKHFFQIRVSHDVDRPSLYAFKSWKIIARLMAGHIVKRKDLRGFFMAPYLKYSTRSRLVDSDPYNNFDWIMDVSEKNEIKSAFYFICGSTSPNMDADYEIDNPAMRELLRRIHSRGHEIGLHSSYNTFLDPVALRNEFDRLKLVCSEEGIQQAEWGGRMHYLRWEQPATLRALNNIGISYDSTLGYADQPGFRCGTCFEYPAFDSVANKLLSLRIRPLIAMETTIFSTYYLGLDAVAGLQKLDHLKGSCEAVCGSFNLLWHNCQLDKTEDRLLYQQVFTKE